MVVFRQRRKCGSFPSKLSLSLPRKTSDNFNANNNLLTLKRQDETDNSDVFFVDVEIPVPIDYLTTCYIGTLLTH